MKKIDDTKKLAHTIQKKVAKIMKKERKEFEEYVEEQKEMLKTFVESTIELKDKKYDGDEKARVYFEEYVKSAIRIFHELFKSYQVLYNIATGEQIAVLPGLFEEEKRRTKIEPSQDQKIRLKMLKNELNWMDSYLRQHGIDPS